MNTSVFKINTEQQLVYRLPTPPAGELIIVHHFLLKSYLTLGWNKKMVYPSNLLKSENIKLFRGFHFMDVSNKLVPNVIHFPHQEENVQIPIQKIRPARLCCLKTCL